MKQIERTAVRVVEDQPGWSAIECSQGNDKNYGQLQNLAVEILEQTLVLSSLLPEAFPIHVLQYL